MRRHCAREFAASALFIATVGCHDSLVKPLPVSAATAQVESGKTVTSSTTEIFVTKEKLAGYVVAKDTNTLSFESDNGLNYNVLFPTNTTEWPPACDPAKTDVTAKHLVAPQAPFVCAINPVAQSGGRVFYKLTYVKKNGASPLPPSQPPTRTDIPFSVVHCNHC